MSAHVLCTFVTLQLLYHFYHQWAAVDQVGIPNHHMIESFINTQRSRGNTTKLRWLMVLTVRNCLLWLFVDDHRPAEWWNVVEIVLMHLPESQCSCSPFIFPAFDTEVCMFCMLLKIMLFLEPTTAHPTSLWQTLALTCRLFTSHIGSKLCEYMLHVGTVLLCSSEVRIEDNHPVKVQNSNQTHQTEQSM